MQAVSFVGGSVRRNVASSLRLGAELRGKGNTMETENGSAEHTVPGGDRAMTVHELGQMIFDVEQRTVDLMLISLGMVGSAHGSRRQH